MGNNFVANGIVIIPEDILYCILLKLTKTQRMLGMIFSKQINALLKKHNFKLNSLVYKERYDFDNYLKFPVKKKLILKKNTHVNTCIS